MHNLLGIEALATVTSYKRVNISATERCNIGRAWPAMEERYTIIPFQPWPFLTDQWRTQFRVPVLQTAPCRNMYTVTQKKHLPPTPCYSIGRLQTRPLCVVWSYF